MVLENNEDAVTEEVSKMKRRLKDISKTLDCQGQLLKLIVQVNNLRYQTSDCSPFNTENEL